jgi:hypothetical protein
VTDGSVTVVIEVEVVTDGVCGLRVVTIGAEVIGASVPGETDAGVELSCCPPVGGGAVTRGVCGEVTALDVGGATEVAGIAVVTGASVAVAVAGGVVTGGSGSGGSGGITITVQFAV